jgi:hypothetical protein
VESALAGTDSQRSSTGTTATSRIATVRDAMERPLAGTLGQLRGQALMDAPSATPRETTRGFACGTGNVERSFRTVRLVVTPTQQQCLPHSAPHAQRHASVSECSRAFATGPKDMIAQKNAANGSVREHRR